MNRTLLNTAVAAVGGMPASIPAMPTLPDAATAALGRRGGERP